MKFSGLGRNNNKSLHLKVGWARSRMCEKSSHTFLSSLYINNKCFQTFVSYIPVAFITFCFHCLLFHQRREKVTFIKIAVPLFLAPHHSSLGPVLHGRPGTPSCPPSHPQDLYTLTLQSRGLSILLAKEMNEFTWSQGQLCY